MEKTIQETPNSRLYNLLELDRDITSKEVERIFRHITLRAHFQKAFEVLYNRDRKFLYDIGGEDVVHLLFNATFGPAVAFLGAWWFTILYCLSVCIWSLLLATCLFFIGFRGDEFTQWNWFIIFIPLFVVLYTGFLVVSLGLIINLLSPFDSRERLPFIRRFPAFINVIVVLLYIIFVNILASWINKPNDYKQHIGSFTTLFILPMMGDFLYYLGELWTGYPRNIRLILRSGVSSEQKSSLVYSFTVTTVCKAILHIVQWVLIGLKVDNKIHCSWYPVVIPAIFILILHIIERVTSELIKVELGISNYLSTLFSGIFSFLINGMILVSVYFIVVHIERGKFDMRLRCALIPLYILLLYCAIASCLTLMFFLQRLEECKRDEKLSLLRHPGQMDSTENYIPPSSQFQSINQNSRSALVLPPVDRAHQFQDDQGPKHDAINVISSPPQNGSGFEGTYLHEEREEVIFEGDDLGDRNHGREDPMIRSEKHGYRIPDQRVDPNLEPSSYYPRLDFEPISARAPVIEENFTETSPYVRPTSSLRDRSPWGHGSGVKEGAEASQLEESFQRQATEGGSSQEPNSRATSSSYTSYSINDSHASDDGYYSYTDYSSDLDQSLEERKKNETEPRDNEKRWFSNQEDSNKGIHAKSSRQNNVIQSQSNRSTGYSSSRPIDIYPKSKVSTPQKDQSIDGSYSFSYTSYTTDTYSEGTANLYDTDYSYTDEKSSVMRR